MVDAGEGVAGVRGGQFIARLRALRRLPGFDLEAVARRWLGEPSVLTKEQHEGRVVIEAGEEHPVNGAAGVRGGQFIARLRALLAWTVVDQGIRTLSE